MDTKILETSEIKRTLISSCKGDAQRLYMGWYRYRTSEPKFKVFPLDAPLVDAIQKFKEHCTDMNLRFIAVRPFLVGLDDQKELKNSNPDYDSEE